MKISAVIITFNEEKNIARCLNSLKNVADEIVVVDSFSTDKTEQICRNFEALFFQRKFENYIVQKNYANSLTSNEFILSLDADEQLSGVLEKAILAEKNQQEFDAFSMNRLTNYCGKWIHHSGWYPDKKVRLWKKSTGKWGGPQPHEFVELERGAKVKHLNGDLLHFSYFSIDQHLEQSQRFSEMAAVSLRRRSKFFLLFKVAFSPAFRFFKTYFLLGGILDGYYGLVICWTASREVFWKYSKALRQS